MLHGAVCLGIMRKAVACCVGLYAQVACEKAVAQVQNR